jgi:hypothetical protein
VLTIWGASSRQATSERSDVEQADIAELKHNVVAMVRAAKVLSVPIIATV